MQQVVYIFADHIQKGIENGTLIIEKSKKTGELIGRVRDAVTGRYVQDGIAKATYIDDRILDPLAISKLNGIQHSLGILQASTAIIGVGVVANIALSAANLWQTLKLREDVKQLRLEIRDGFIDLKQALKNQGIEIIQHINEVAQDVKFNQHRLELIKAYGKFIEATKLIKTSLAFQDIEARKRELANARQTLGEALAIYNNTYLLDDICNPGKLRRYECAWIIEQTIIMTYQLQNELNAVQDRLLELRDTIENHCQTIAENCEDMDELDFIFPEINHIYNHDLVNLKIWQNETDWKLSLSSSELKELTIIEESNIDFSKYSYLSVNLDKPKEMIIYEESKEKSHFLSLYIQLQLLMFPDRRQVLEEYISDQAIQSGHTMLTASNLEKASNLTIANLLCYFDKKED